MCEFIYNRLTEFKFVTIYKWYLNYMNNFSLIFIVFIVFNH